MGLLDWKCKALRICAVIFDVVQALQVSLIMVFGGPLF
jgi:hypothetical protein